MKDSVPIVVPVFGNPYPFAVMIDDPKRGDEPLRLSLFPDVSHGELMDEEGRCWTAYGWGTTEQEALDMASAGGDMARDVDWLNQSVKVVEIEQ